MTKKIVIISQDYDGCYSIMTDAGYNGEVNGRNKKTWQWYKSNGTEAIEIINPIREKYNNYLSSLTIDANEVHVYVGSDRQSYTLDNNNNHNNKNGSVFPALEALCHARTSEKQPWQFEPLLLADPKDKENNPYGRSRGTAYQQMKKPNAKQYEVNEPSINFDYKGKKTHSKKPLILNQMWDAYRQNPKDTELEFNFLDDRQDLIEDVLSLNPVLMPPNMILIVSKFDYIDMVVNKKGDIYRCGEITSKLPSMKIEPIHEPANKPPITVGAATLAGGGLGYFSSKKSSPNDEIEKSIIITP